MENMKDKLIDLLNASIDRSQEYIKLLDSIEKEPTNLFDIFQDKDSYFYLIRTIESSKELIGDKLKIHDFENYIAVTLSKYIDPQFDNIKTELANRNHFPSPLTIKSKDGGEIVRFNLRSKKFSRHFEDKSGWYEKSIVEHEQYIKEDEEYIARCEKFKVNPWREVKRIADILTITFKRRNIIANISKLINGREKSIEVSKKEITRLREMLPAHIENIDRLEKSYQQLRPFLIRHGFTEQDERIY
jgi:hypothetical protein